MACQFIQFKKIEPVQNGSKWIIKNNDAEISD